ELPKTIESRFAVESETVRSVERGEVEKDGEPRRSTKHHISNTSVVCADEWIADDDVVETIAIDVTSGVNLAPIEELFRAELSGAGVHCSEVDARAEACPLSETQIAGGSAIRGAAHEHIGEPIAIDVPG